jgi:hypothetical protein
MKYALIKHSDIDFDIQKAAHMALASARKELRLPMVKIKWFNVAEYVSNPNGTFECDDEIRGQFKGVEPDTIYVKSWQSVKATQETVYHETFHLWQFKQGLGFGEHSEGLAQGYAEDILKRMRLHGQDEETYLEHMVGKDWSERPKAKTDKKSDKKTESTQPTIKFGVPGIYKRTGFCRQPDGSYGDDAGYIRKDCSRTLGTE